MNKENKKKKIEKILIANRGEIASRILKTCQRIGIKTVCVYSSADISANFVELADEAYLIGAGPSAESYLQQELLIEIAQKTNCNAIHPGYGFLSENTAFAQKLADNDIIFIGPSPEAIDAMGDKAKAKTLMEQAGVPLIQGYHGDDQSPETLLENAKKIGFPVLLKASAGGGGKGMKPVFDESTFDEALQSAKREAMASFSNDDMMLEKYLTNPRHVEIQIFGDHDGDIIHLFERDCSLQRRHQKVIEEAPAPNIEAPIREKMYQAAINAAKAVNYVGAGTVEFLLDEDGSFYFMEMNTRLQVEHPVTEAITGLDLVEWQIMIASGEPLPLSQNEISQTGHAIEARLYAEDALNDFMPQAGTLNHLIPPLNTRFDSAFDEINYHYSDVPQKVSIYYDPMIAKIIAHGATREQAIDELAYALKELQIDGVHTNESFLHACITHDNFKKAQLTTKFIDQNIEELIEETRQSPTAFEGALAFIALRIDSILNAYQLNPFFESLNLRERFGGVKWGMTGDANTLLLSCEDGETFTFEDVRVEGDVCYASYDDKIFYWSALIKDKSITLYTDDGRFDIPWDNKRYTQANVNANAAPELQAPMPSKVVKININEGDTVQTGQTLMVLEAMKMEHQIKAPTNGIVTEVLAKEGEQVEEGFDLVIFTPSVEEQKAS